MFGYVYFLIESKRCMGKTSSWKNTSKDVLIERFETSLCGTADLLRVETQIGNLISAHLFSTAAVEFKLVRLGH